MRQSNHNEADPNPTPDFEQLWRKYSDKIYNYIYYRVAYDQGLAEDLSATVFVKAIDSIQRGNGPHTSLRSWLYQIARNAITDHYRSPDTKNFTEAPRVFADNEDGTVEDQRRKKDKDRHGDEVGAGADALGVFMEFKEVVKEDGVFVNKGKGPRRAKADYIISGPREWMPSAILGRPSPTKARLLVKVLERYSRYPDRRWLVLRQCVDAVYTRLPNADRELFLAKIKRIGERQMRFEAKLHMSVRQFVYQLERDQAGIFEGHELEPSIRNHFEYQASVWAVVGQTGNTAHVNMFGISVHQGNAGDLLVDWEEVQGNGCWAENVEQWIWVRFDVQAIPIVVVRGDEVELSERERDNREIARGWPRAKRARDTKRAYCDRHGIKDTKTLDAWCDKYGVPQ